MALRPWLPIAAIAPLIAACGGSGTGGAGDGDTTPPVSPRLALFTSAQPVTGFQASTYGSRLTGPQAVDGSVTADTLDIGALTLEAGDFEGEDGLYDLYSHGDYIDLPDRFGFDEYQIVTTDARVLRSGEAGAAYSYASYGRWETSVVAHLATGIVASDGATGYTAFGIQAGDIPAAGGANYSGVWDGTLSTGTTMAGTASLSADFGAETLTGTLTVNPDTLSAGIEISEIALDASFASGDIIGLASAQMVYQGEPIDFSGDLGGDFYGPAAAEVAGVFLMAGGSGSYSLAGGFAARQ